MPSVVEHAVRSILRARGFSSRTVRTSVGEMHALAKKNGTVGRTLALLHGFGASSAQLAPLLTRMEAHFDEVIAYDLPAHGFSDVPDPLTDETMETGLREMLERTLTRPAVLFGNSMGGFAAIRFAIERPDLVERLVLCAPGGAPMTHDELDQLRAIFNLRSHGDAVQFIDRLLARPARLRHLYALGVRRRLSNEGLQKLLGGVTPDRLLSPDQLRNLSRPALILWGRQDEILPRSSLAFFQTHLEQARIEEVDGFGHSPHIEAPDRVAEKILEYVHRP